MIKRREFQRFDLSTSDSLRASLKSSQAMLRLYTFGQGGCAFLGFDPFAELIPPQNFPISVWMKTSNGTEQDFQLQAQLIYVRPYNETQEMMFGFEFSKESKLQAEPLATTLEHMAQAGLVERQVQI